MVMRPLGFHRTALGVLAFTFLCNSAAAQAPYSVTTVQPPANGSWCDVNAAGQLAGAAQVGNGFSVFLGSISTATALALPAGWQTAAIANPVGINDAGEVLGSALTPSGTGQPFLATQTQSTGIPLPSGWQWASGVAVNNAGQVTGYGFNGGTGAVAFIGNGLGTAALPMPDGATQSATYAINTSGVAAGAYYIPVANNPDFMNANRAFTGNASAIAALTIPQPSQSLAQGINDSGQVAGWVQLSPNFVPQAFIVTNGGFTSVPLPEGAVAIKNFGNLVSNACGYTVSVRSGHILNNAGVVIGNASTSQGSDPNTSANTEAWIWNSKDGTRLFSNLVPAPWNIINAISISNSGLILAYGTCSGGVCPSSGTYSGYVLLVPQGGACDVNGNLTADVLDVQLIVNEALGVSRPLNDLNGDGVVNVVDIQAVANSVLGMGCTF